MKVGFLGGTFDPIHCGHLHLALEIFEKRGLDRVLFCPANCSPMKTDAEPLVSADDRMAMVKLAIAPISAFSLIDLEIHRSGCSYTVDTIRQLKAQHPKDEFHLILGEDLVPSFARWKEVETLIELAPPFIGSRHHRLPKTDLPLALQKKVEEGLTLISLLDISSTELRQRLKKGLYCGHLLPAKVLDYIERKHLYCSSHV